MGVFEVAQGGEWTGNDSNESCCTWENECVNLEDLRFDHHGLNEGNEAEAVSVHSGQGRQAADSTIRLSHRHT